MANELWRGERLVQRLSPQAQESIAMLPRMRFVRAGWWAEGSRVRPLAPYPYQTDGFFCPWHKTGG